jgi:hypothetical protein
MVWTAAWTDFVICLLFGGAIGRVELNNFFIYILRTFDSK